MLEVTLRAWFVRASSKPAGASTHVQAIILAASHSRCMLCVTILTTGFFVCSYRGGEAADQIGL